MNLSHHAVERFRERWRPTLTLEQAHAELEQLLAAARPTRSRTLVGDAQRWIAVSAAGERIVLAVRDNTVITVMPRGTEGTKDVEIGATEELAAESEDDRAACMRILAEEARARVAVAPVRAKPVVGRSPTPTERSRKRNAEQTLARAAAGEHITQNAQIRARIVLERWKERFGDIA